MNYEVLGAKMAKDYVQEFQAESLTEYVTVVEELRASVGGELWYRGQSKPSYKLTPGLFRHPKKKTASDVFELEEALLSEFVFRHPSFISIQTKDDWDTLFLMQHYRVPTRLLDWSASPLAGLFFALDDHDKKTDAIVWVLNPCEWNRGMLEDIGDYERVFSTADDFLNQYLPRHEGQSRRGEPLAIHGVLNNARINAQRGKFVVFGQKIENIEYFAGRLTSWKKPPLAKIVIPKASIPTLFPSLFEFGVTHTAIFPDLEGLALELRCRYEF